MVFPTPPSAVKRPDPAFLFRRGDGARARGCIAALLLAGSQIAAAELPLPERDRLTGDWHGLRSELAADGIEIGLANHGDLMRVAAGGSERRTAYADLVEPSLAVDLEKLMGWRGANFYLHGIGTYGRDPGEASGSVAAPSNLAASVDTFKLFEAWIEQRLFDDRLSLLAGLYAADSEFDVKESAGVFMNGAFGTGLELSESGLNGPCIFPVSCVGIRLRYQPSETVYAQLAVLDGVAGDPDQPKGTQIALGGGDGVLVLGELGHQRSGGQGRFFRAALGAWHYTTTFDDVLAVDADGEPLRRDGTGGVYALVEGTLFAERDATQGLSAFLRAGVADAEVNQFRAAYAAGLAYTGLLPGRDEDVAGLGVAIGVNGDRFRRARRLADEPVASRETTIEATYRLQPLAWLAVQFDLQYIADPGTDPALDDALVVGCRYEIEF